MGGAVLLLAPRAGRYRAAIAAPAGIELLCAERLADVREHLRDIAAVITFPMMLDPASVRRMGRLEWIQALTSGIDALEGLPVPDHVRITNARGIQADQLSELVFLQMLWFLRDVPGIARRQAARQWAPAPQRLLAGKRILIAGVGAIGETLALRCRMFGMTTIGCSTSRVTAAGFDRIAPMDHLAREAAEADFLVVLTPYRAETHHLVDARVIAALPAHAVLINVSRGAVVDEDALTAALERKRIGGAALDVFSREPLPADSPLWARDDVLITPHIGGFSETHAEQIGPLVSENLARWAAGSFPLINEIRMSREIRWEHSYGS